MLFSSKAVYANILPSLTEIDKENSLDTCQVLKETILDMYRGSLQRHM